MKLQTVNQSTNFNLMLMRINMNVRKMEANHHECEKDEIIAQVIVIFGVKLEYWWLKFKNIILKIAFKRKRRNVNKSA